MSIYAIVRPALAAEPWSVWSQRFTDARLMHERLNSYAEFWTRPACAETGLIQWLTQAGLNRPCRCPPCPAWLHQLEARRGDGARPPARTRRPSSRSTVQPPPKSRPCWHKGRRRRRHEELSEEAVSWRAGVIAATSSTGFWPKATGRSSPVAPGREERAAL